MVAQTWGLIIVGAGPAGLIAAIEASRSHDNILVLEKMQKPALKLRITGKGRCNITNAAELPDFIERFGKNGRFLKYAFNQFFNTDLLEYLQDLGVESKLERGGRYFPKSDSALELVKALINKTRACGVEIRTHSDVVDASRSATGGFRIDLHNRSTGERQVLECGRMLLAAGGRSYPRTGSNGSVYALAEKFGHTIRPQHPALVPLFIKGPECPQMEGLSLRNAMVSIWQQDRKLEQAFGEMLFTGAGVSGPVILTLSRSVVPLLDMGQKLALSIDLKPALDHSALDRRLLREIEEHKLQHIDKLLQRLLPRKMIPVFQQRLGIAMDKPLQLVSATERKAIRVLLKDFRLEISGHDNWDSAIVTAGGVSVKEVDSRTMESKLEPGLYFAGEILDLDGDTGGFNLQAAFSTGWLAGNAMAGPKNSAP